MSLHLNVPRWDDVRLVIQACPYCRRRRRMLAAHQPWYGTTVTCLTCGDRWTDGETHARPFERGWRMASVAAAKRLAVERGVLRVAKRHSNGG